MHKTNDKLRLLSDKISSGAPLKIMIIGLGSVGGYLLDYLNSWTESEVELHVCGRVPEKMAPDVNIMRVANIIRQNRVKPIICHPMDLNDVDGIAAVLEKVSPDFIVNSSRAYSGLKYGSISWHNVRAYGLWSPLSIKFIRNIMVAYERAGGAGIVINTSYSDAVNPWLKSAGLSCPDFGSGNLNHLIPRIKMAAAKQLGTDDVAGIEVVLATSHFHDVVISKEGHTEGVEPLISLSRAGRPLDVDLTDIYRNCALPMPVDAKRNMMNASSNFEIIAKIVNAVRTRSTCVIHSPGVAGYLGGYPVRIDFREGASSDRRISFVEDFFSLSAMQAHNRQSIALDGIENVADGVLTYTDDLLRKVKSSFDVTVDKQVPLEAIERVSQLLIDKIIAPSVGR